MLHFEFDEPLLMNNKDKRKHRQSPIKGGTNRELTVQKVAMEIVLVQLRESDNRLEIMNSK